MVQVTNLFVATLIVVPALAIPLTKASGSQRREPIESDSEIDARKFSFGKIFGAIGKVAKVATSFIREDDMEATRRDFDEDDDLVSRDPFSLGKVFGEIGKVAGKVESVAGTVGSVASKFIREDEMDSEMLERDLANAVFFRDEETGDIYVVRMAGDEEELD
ncbi:hypothetical protein CPC08DRAFT_769528 [Agrocybe pediades]|nr:hypothetical protein CPC08DRAFT_769528 [Agrocybe pediades]